ncbi:(Fe-S)-binding protein [Methylorubrum aminovorans]
MTSAAPLTLVFPGLVWLMAALALVQVSRRATLWRVGTAAPVAWLDGLAKLPRRYLVDVHHVVARDAYASRMHAVVAGGLLASSILTALAILPPLADFRPYWFLVALAFGVTAIGSLLVGARRYPAKQKRLSAGRFQILPFLLLAYAIGGTITALVLAFGAGGVFGSVALALAAAGGLGLAFEVRHGPMRHAAAGALHLVAHPRPGRFEGRPDTALQPLDLDAPRLGSEMPADFTWNRLLSYDSCVSCGRCETACPAFAAGQPLNPKKLIQDLVTGLSPAEPAYAGNPYPGGRAGQGERGTLARLIGPDARIHPDTLWSCTTCRACVEECPMMIEHVDAVVSLRRHETLERGGLPEKAVVPVTELRQAGDPGGRPLASRTDFAAGVELPRIADRGGAEILLWLGEGAYDLRYGRSLRALVRLLREAGVDFAVLGPEERDTGDLARRLGDEVTFQALARENIATLAKYRFSRIVTADPHALHALRNEYPAFGGRYTVVHHTAFLLELIQAGKLNPGRLPDLSVTYHDPCYLARYNGETEAPRAVLDAIGVARSEMARSGRRAMCCGGGGGAPVSDVPGERRIPDIRMAQAAETGAGIVAVACPSCTAMLEGVTDRKAEIRDVAELLLQAVEAGR